MLSCTRFDALCMINACLKDTAKVSKSDYDLPFFLDIHKQQINNSVSAFLPFENTFILSATIKTSPMVEGGKIARKKNSERKQNASESYLYSIILNGWSSCDYHILTLSILPAQVFTISRIYIFMLLSKPAYTWTQRSSSKSP